MRATAPLARGSISLRMNPHELPAPDVVAELCAQATLATGDSCTMQVAFTSPSPGDHTAMIRLLDNGGGSPRVVVLKGTRKG